MGGLTCTLYQYGLDVTMFERLFYFILLYYYYFIISYFIEGSNECMIFLAGGYNRPR